MNHVFFSHKISLRFRFFALNLFIFGRFLYYVIKVFANKSCNTNRIFLIVSIARLAELPFFSNPSKSRSVFLFRIEKFTLNALKIVH